jgi:hypothetical protein
MSQCTHTIWRSGHCYQPRSNLHQCLPECTPILRCPSLLPGMPTFVTLISPLGCLNPKELALQHHEPISQSVFRFCGAIPFPSSGGRIAAFLIDRREFTVAHTARSSIWGLIFVQYIIHILRCYRLIRSCFWISTDFFAERLWISRRMFSYYPPQVSGLLLAILSGIQSKYICVQ